MNNISDRILDRELGIRGSDKQTRIIGRRLHEGYIHYKRYLEILNTISKHGFGYIFDKIKNIELAQRLDDERTELKGSPRGVRIRLMFEELGPTFIKIGQILSTRPDLVPAEFIHELEKLRDKVKPIDFKVVKETIENELNTKLGSIFKKFNEHPVGVASIGQVHKAVTIDNKLVAVKVQKPRIKETILADLEILEDISELFGDLTGIAEVMDPLEMVKEFKRLLTRELDYTIEARSIEHFQKDFTNVESVLIPKIYWKLTTKNVLTMDFVKGISVDEVNELKKAGIDTDQLAITIGTAVGRMIFVNGYFHGDPHGGNIFVLTKGRIALLDYGSIGYLDNKMRDKIRLFYFSIAQKNVSKAAEIFLDICKVPESSVNRPAFEQDFREFLDYQGLLKAGYEIAEGMNQRLVSIALKHGFAPPTEFILLERSLLETEGVCRKLTKNFDINQMLMPILSDVIKEKASDVMDPIGAIQSAQSYRELMQKAPKKMVSILEKLDSGNIMVQVDASLLENLRRDFWRMYMITGISVLALVLLFMVSFMGFNLKIPFLHISISSLSIIVIWFIVIWWLYRRWRGPRMGKR